MTQTVVAYRQSLGLEQTRSRAYKKNDQGWVEQKSGAIVRRLVGYGRLSGRSETTALAQLYAVCRLYLNFFQPSFKLKSKTHDGARVHKTCHPTDDPVRSPTGSICGGRRNQDQATRAICRARSRATPARDPRCPAHVGRADRDRKTGPCTTTAEHGRRHVPE